MIKQQILEQTVDVPVPSAVEETVTVPKVLSEERFITMNVDQILDVPIRQTVERSSMCPRLCHRSVS
eukprot:1056028-Amphidinium_carterae.1